MYCYIDMRHIRSYLFVIGTYYITRPGNHDILLYKEDDIIVYDTGILKYITPTGDSIEGVHTNQYSCNYGEWTVRDEIKIMENAIDTIIYTSMHTTYICQANYGGYYYNFETTYEDNSTVTIQVLFRLDMYPRAYKSPVEIVLFNETVKREYR